MVPTVKRLVSFNIVIFHAASSALWLGLSQDSRPHHNADHNCWNIRMDGPRGKTVQHYGL